MSRKSWVFFQTKLPEAVSVYSTQEKKVSEEAESTLLIFDQSSTALKAGLAGAPHSTYRLGFRITLQAVKREYFHSQSQKPLLSRECHGCILQKQRQKNPCNDSQFLLCFVINCWLLIKAAASQHAIILPLQILRGQAGLYSTKILFLVSQAQL